MVRALHAAGIEVILDVVYNHTAEGNHLGPTLSMRGIDNAAYYRLEDKDKRYYTDYTGTGNSLNVGNPHALQLIMDSLRYWVLEMHVDGFRFDLASALAREFYDVDKPGDLLRARAAGSGGLAGQAHRRAVGRRSRRLPGGQFPAAVDGVERQVPRHGARLLAGRAAGPGRVRLASDRARPTCTSTPGAGPWHPSTSSPPTTASRCVTSSATTRSTTRPTAKTTRTAPIDNRSMNFGVEGPTDDPAINYPARTPAAQLHRDAAAVARRADAAARRRARPHAAGQQQRLRAGQRADLGATGTTSTSRSSSSRPPSPACAASTRPSAAADSSTGVRCAWKSAKRGADIAWLRPDGTLDAARGLGFGIRAIGRRVPQRARASASAIVAASRSSTSTSSCCSTPATTIIDFHIPLIEYSPKWDVLVDTAGEKADTHADRAGIDGVDCTRRRSSCSSEHDLPEPEVDHSVAASLAARSSRLRRMPGHVSEGGAASTEAMPPRPTSTYRLQIRPAFDLDAAAAGRAVPARPRRRLGVSLAAAARDRGLGPRLRRRGPVAGRPGARRSRGARPLRRGRPRGGPRHPGRHRPEPHGDRRPGAEPVVVGRAHPRSRVALRRSVRHRLGVRRRARCACRSSAGRSRRRSPTWRWMLRQSQQPGPDAAQPSPGVIRYFDHVLPLAPGSVPADAVLDDPRNGPRDRGGAALGADLLATRGRRAELPPVLRDHDARGPPRRGPLGVRRDPRRGAALGARRARGRPAHRPSGRAGRPGRIPRAPRGGDGRRVRAGREDPRAWRAAAGVVGDRRHDRLRRARGDRPRAGRPRGRGGAGCARCPASRRHRAGRTTTSSTTRSG